MKPNRKPAPSPASGERLKLYGRIHAIMNEQGIDDETYRDILWVNFDKCTSKTSLSEKQLHRLVGHLLNVKKHPNQDSQDNRMSRMKSVKPRRQKGKNVVHLVSQAELGKIDAVAALIPWQYEDGKERFLAARLGIKNGKVKTAGEAYKAIEALKMVFENHMKKLHGPAWWAMRFDDPAVMRYIEEHRPAEWR